MASVFQRGGRWLAKYRNERGLWATRSCGQADKQTAKGWAAAWEAGALDRREGRIDPKDEQYRDAEAQPIGEHVEAFRTMLTGKNDTAEHVKETVAHVARIVKACKAERLSDLTPEAVRNALAAIRASGRSLRTCNAILRSVKTFTGWMVAEGHARSNDLRHIKASNVDIDRRRIRRELPDDELALLIQTTEAGPVRFGLDGKARAMAYRCAAGTGFRRSELSSLTPESFRMDDSPPTIAVGAAYSKHRRDDTQPIDPDLAATLKPWLAGKPARKPVFPLPLKSAEMLRDDLDAARQVWIGQARTKAEHAERSGSSALAYCDESGDVFDFHSFRVGYVSAVVAGGASVATCKELARHADPRTTIKHYAKTRSADVRAAIPAVPGTRSNPESEAVELRATGTYEHRPNPRAPQAHQTGRNSQPRITKHGESATEDSQNADSRKPLPRADIGNAPRQIARRCTDEPEGIRTLNIRIDSPVL